MLDDPIRPLTSHLINHTIKMNKTCGRSKEKLVSNFLLWIPEHLHASIGWPARNFIISVQTLDTGKRTCLEWWIIGMSGERKSGNSVLSAQLDNNIMMMILFRITLAKIFPEIQREMSYNLYIYIYIYIYQTPSHRQSVTQAHLPMVQETWVQSQVTSYQRL